MTPDTEAKRNRTLYAFVLLIIGTGVAASASAVLLFQSAGNDWVLNLRATGTLAAFISAVIYLIRWQDRWAQAHADEEFRLKRMELDIDRASWLVEMMLEWRVAADTEILGELLERLAYGMFDQRSSHSTALNHPAEDAAMALANIAAKMKMVLPGVGELEIDKNGLRKLTKRASEGQ